MDLSALAAIARLRKDRWSDVGKGLESFVSALDKALEQRRKEELNKAALQRYYDVELMKEQARAEEARQKQALLEQDIEKSKTLLESLGEIGVPREQIRQAQVLTELAKRGLISAPQGLHYVSPGQYSPGGVMTPWGFAPMTPHLLRTRPGEAVTNFGIGAETLGSGESTMPAGPQLYSLSPGQTLYAGPTSERPGVQNLATVPERTKLSAHSFGGIPFVFNPKTGELTPRIPALTDEQMKNLENLGTLTKQKTSPTVHWQEGVPYRVEGDKLVPQPLDPELQKQINEARQKKKEDERRKAVARIFLQQLPQDLWQEYTLKHPVEAAKLSSTAYTSGVKPRVPNDWLATPEGVSAVENIRKHYEQLHGVKLQPEDLVSEVPPFEGPEPSYPETVFEYDPLNDRLETVGRK